MSQKKAQSKIFRSEALSNRANHKNETFVPILRNDKLFMVLWITFFVLVFTLLILVLFQKIPVLVSGTAYPISNKLDCSDLKDLNVVIIISNNRKEIKSGMKTTIVKNGEVPLHTVLEKSLSSIKNCQSINYLSQNSLTANAIAFAKVDTHLDNSEYKSYIQVDNIYSYQLIIDFWKFY